MYLKVTIINNSKYRIHVKESTGGIYRPLRTVESGGKYVFKLDVSATYREYPITTSAGDRFSLSSDDALEFSRIEVEDTDERSRVNWYGIRRESKHKVAALPGERVKLTRGESEPEKDGSTEDKQGRPESSKSDSTTKSDSSKSDPTTKSEPSMSDLTTKREPSKFQTIIKHGLSKTTEFFNWVWNGNSSLR